MIRKSPVKRSVRLRAFAKVNLCLHVVGKRTDGYHELRTIFQTISLHDNLELSLASANGISFETTDPQLPKGQPGELGCCFLRQRVNSGGGKMV